jgi:hypothetical protein
MIPWLVASTSKPQLPTSIHRLPVEIQDRTLYDAPGNFVAAAKLGCELGLPLLLTWDDRDDKIGLRFIRTHRNEDTPMESQVMLNGLMIGLPYT